MTDNELTTKIFKCNEYMTTEQQNFSTAFQNMIEAEYQLCASQMKKANQLAMSGGDSTNKEEIVKIDYGVLKLMQFVNTGRIDSKHLLKLSSGETLDLIKNWQGNI
jgi:hypothetical protein